MTGSASRRWLLAILVAGLLLRLGMAFVERHRALQFDELSYDQIAQNVADGHGIAVGSGDEPRRPTAERGPTYVLWVGGTYALVGHRPWVIFLQQSLLDLLGAALVWYLARRWFANPWASVAAAALYAFYLPFAISATWLLTETITQVCLLAIVALFMESMRSGRASLLLTSGAVMGVCALTKPQLAPMAAALFIAARPRWGWANTIRRGLLFVAVTTLVMSPWLVRNARTFHALVPGLSTGGLGLWLGAGAYQGQTLGGIADPLIPEDVRARLVSMDEIERSRWGAAEAMRVVRADPVAYVTLMVRKFWRLWFNLGFEGAPSRGSLLVAGINLLAISLALFAARRAAPDPWATKFMLSLFVLWNVLYLPFVTSVRYAFPFYALMFIFSGAGLVELVNGLRRGGRPRAAAR